ncbi:hypothetical protein Tco_1346610 [Tanacetum coccineum]
MGRSIQWKSVLIVKPPLLLLSRRGCRVGIQTSFCGLCIKRELLFFAIMGILSLLITSDDKGVEEHFEPVIPRKGVDVVEVPISPPLVPEVVVPPGDHEIEDAEDEI